MLMYFGGSLRKLPYFKGKTLKVLAGKAHKKELEACTMSLMENTMTSATATERKTIFFNIQDDENPIKTCSWINEQERQCSRIIFLKDLVWA